MARIRLSCVRKPLRIIDQRGSETIAERVRLLGLLVFGEEPQAVARDCIIDTASALSVFPKKVWEHFDSRIEWLTELSQAASVRIVGGQFLFRYGRIDAKVLQPDLKASFAPVSILGQFLEDQGQLSHIVLGLSKGIFQKRKLTINIDHDEVWLEEIDVDTGLSG